MDESYKTLQRLERLRQLNTDRNWISSNLYRLMYKEELYILAYERMKSAPGNMTPGTDGKTIDGFSKQMIHNIIQEMRTEHFQFKPVRTVYLPKPNGKKRRLGIPSTRDKIVQEVIHIRLECIYDSPKGPYFLETSHGFRPNRSCHTALREIRGKWPAINWFLEGDIQSCFDAIDHGVLVSLLRKKIRDERFLNLIWKLLRAGYLDLREARHDSLAGAPQGGLASPILANVYLHELDEKVEEMSRQVERGGKRKQRNLLHKKLSERKLRLVKKGATRTKEFRELVRQIRSIPAVEVNDPNFIRLKYLRYADDWLVGICGPRKLAEQVKEELKTFLCQRLKLTLPRGKDENYPCPQRTGPLSRNTMSHWQRGHPTGGHDLQRLGAAYQTSLNGFGNGHDGPKRGTHQEAPCQRILYCKRTTHHEVRMDTPGCRSDHSPLQWHQSRDTKLLPLCGQLRTTYPYPICSQILTCSYTGSEIQMLRTPSLQTIRQNPYHHHQSQGWKTRSLYRILQHQRLEKTTQRLSNRPCDSRSTPMEHQSAITLKIGNAMLHL